MPATGWSAKPARLTRQKSYRLEPRLSRWLLPVSVVGSCLKLSHFSETKSRGSSTCPAALTTPTPGRERRAGRDGDRSDPARPCRHGQPVVEQRVDASHRDAGHEERERDPTRVPRRRVGAVGAEGRRQPVVLRSDERSRRQRRDEQPQPPGNRCEDHDGGDDDRDRAALALRAEPAGEHRRGETERERADDGVDAAPCAARASAGQSPTRKKAAWALTYDTGAVSRPSS